MKGGGDAPHGNIVLNAFDLSDLIIYIFTTVRHFGINRSEARASGSICSQIRYDKEREYYTIEGKKKEKD